MPAGRKPIPTAVKKARGTLKSGRQRKEPVPKGPLPACPAHLTKEARAEWARTVKAVPPGLLTSLDLGILATYCQHYGRWVTAEKNLLTEGEVIQTAQGNLIQNPWLGIANRAMQAMQKAAVELGFTPSARTRVSIPDAPPDKGAGDKGKGIEDFLGNGGLRLAQ